MIGKVDLKIDLLCHIQFKAARSEKLTVVTPLVLKEVDSLFYLSLIDTSQTEGKVLCTPRFCETVLPSLREAAKRTFSGFEGFGKIDKSIDIEIRTDFEGSEDESEQKSKKVGLNESLVQSIVRGRDIGPRKEDTECAYRQMLLAIKKIKPGDSDFAAYHDMMGNLYAQCLAFDKESGENDSGGAAFIKNLIQWSQGEREACVTYSDLRSFEIGFSPGLPGEAPLLLGSNKGKLHVIRQQSDSGGNKFFVHTHREMLVMLNQMSRGFRTPVVVSTVFRGEMRRLCEVLVQDSYEEYLPGDTREAMQCVLQDMERGTGDLNPIFMPDEPLKDPKHEKNRVAVQSWLSLLCNSKQGCKELIYADIVLHLGYSFLGLEPLFADFLQTKTITIFSDGLTILDEELERMEQTTGGVLHPWTRKPLAPIIADNVPLKRLKRLVLDSLDAFKEKNPIQHDRFFEALQDASGKGGNWELMQALKNPKTGLLLTLGGVSTESEERISFKYFIGDAVGKIEFEKKLSIVIQLAQLLERIHRAGINYGGLCPQKIYCMCKKESSGDEKFDVVEVYLKGFDQAAIESSPGATRAESVCSPVSNYYVPPECYDGFRRDTRSDIFSFGLVACELLMGKSLSKLCGSSAAIMYKLSCGMQLASFKNEKFPQKIRDNLSSLIERCCSNLPQDRPSILEVEEVLVECYIKLTKQSDIKSDYDYDR